jgi:hypothetical protein
MMSLARGDSEDCHRFGCGAMRSCRSLTTFWETLLSASSLYCILKILALSLHKVIKFPREGYFREDSKFGQNLIIFIYY